MTRRIIETYVSKMKPAPEHTRPSLNIIRKEKIMYADNEFLIAHNMDTFVVFARAFWTEDGQEVLSGIEFEKPDRNHINVKCSFVPPKDSIVVYLSEHGAVGNMQTQVYDTDNDGTVDVSQVAQSLSEDYDLDGGEW